MLNLLQKLKTLRKQKKPRNEVRELRKQKSRNEELIRTQKKQISQLKKQQTVLLKRLRAARDNAGADFSMLNGKEIDICGAMSAGAAGIMWGDHHFAEGLKKELERDGFQVNIRPYCDWYKESRAKYTIVLRGLMPYFPAPMKGQKFILWNISHPEDLTPEECNLYDYVLFASEKMKKKMENMILPPSDVLMQCTDPEVMYRDIPVEERKPELLFVGNSRGVFRKIIQDLLPTEHDLAIYGSGWEKFPVQQYLKGEHLDNAGLGQAYHEAKIVLNDHWDDMREEGIVSNRIFDALAAGAFVISDDMPEIEELFHGAVETYRTRDELREKIEYYLSHEEERDHLARQGQAEVLMNHTFRKRAEQIEAIIQRLEGI